MAWSNWFRKRPAPRPATPGLRRRQTRLGFDTLEDRATPSVTTTLASVALPTNAGNATSITTNSAGASFTSDGNQVVFASDANNLVSGDTNGTTDIFVANLTTGSITRVSVDATGAQINGPSFSPSISADGRYIAFQSYATNLVSGDTNGAADIFVKDMTTGAVTLISASASGTLSNNVSASPAISANGQFVVFSSFATNLSPADTDSTVDIYRKNVSTGAIDVVDVTSGNVKANQNSDNPAISADGRYVAFASNATNLIGSANSKTQIYRKDMTGGALVLVSADSSGTIGGDTSVTPVMSADGNIVAFASNATNLVAGDTNTVADVFTKNVTTGATTRISVGSSFNQLTAGSSTPSISDDGTKLSFTTADAGAVSGDNNQVVDVFVRDTTLSTTTRYSTSASSAQAVRGGDGGRLSGSGAKIAFFSASDDLNAIDINGVSDLYVKTLSGGALKLVTQGLLAYVGASDNSFLTASLPQLSGDGNSIVFVSSAINLVNAADTNGAFHDVYLRDLKNSVNVLVSSSANGVQGNGDSTTASLNPAGAASLVAFSSTSTSLTAGDTQNHEQVYIKNPSTGAILPVSVKSDGTFGNGDSFSPVISGNGQFMAFITKATNLFTDTTATSADVVLVNLSTGAFTLVSTGANGQVAGNITGVSISDDGRYVAFASDANGLVTGDNNSKYDVFVKDVTGGTLTLVSKNSSGTIGDGNSASPVISGDGKMIAFASDSANLVANDTNSVADVFRSDWKTGANGTIVRVSTATDGSQATGGGAGQVSISQDGRYVSFASDATNLVTGDTNTATDVFIKDVTTGTTYLASRSASGTIGNAASLSPSLSRDGRTVAYVSQATNLTNDDVNTYQDVFVTNLNHAPAIVVNGSTTLSIGQSLSLDASATTDADSDSLTYTWDLNGDGVFGDATGPTISLTNAQLSVLGLVNGPAVFAASVRVTDVFGPTTGTFALTITGTPKTSPVTTLVSVAQPTTASNLTSLTSGAGGASFSSDENMVVFVSDANNLVSGDTNSATDVFVENLTTGVITRVSTDSAGNQSNGSSFAPTISADGRYVAFQSYATNLVANDTNGTADIFVKDLSTGAVTLVSASSTGTLANGMSASPVISSNGRYVVFSTFASNLTAADPDGVADIVRKDLQSGAVDLVSTTGSVKGNQNSDTPTISSDGRYVAFATNATNLAAADTNGKTDIYRKDMVGGGLVLVSAASGGTVGGDNSTSPVISANGNIVAFVSAATNLVAGDTNTVNDVFTKNLTTNAVTRISVANAGTQLTTVSGTPSISDDGTKVTFVSQDTAAVTGDTNAAIDVFVRDTTLGTTTRVSTTATNAQATRGGDGGKLSPSAAKIAFFTASDDLDATDVNGVNDVYVKTLASGALKLVTHGTSAYVGASDNSFLNAGVPQISGDSKSVVFVSSAVNLVAGADANGSFHDVYLRNLAQSTTLRVSSAANGTQGNGDSTSISLNPTGAVGLVAFSTTTTSFGGDTGAFEQVWLKDPSNGQIAPVSIKTGNVFGNGASFSPVISADGKYVAFITKATNLFTDTTPTSADVVIVKLSDGTISLVSSGPNGQVAGNISGISISDDGRYVAFASDANGLVPGDNNGKLDVFVKDTVTGTLTLVSKSGSGTIGNDDSAQPFISGDGKYVTFTSAATNLVANDTNATADVFRSDWKNGANGVIVRVSETAVAGQANGQSANPSISEDGRYVAFATAATNLFTGDSNSATDIVVKDMNTGYIYLASQSSTGQIGNGGSLTPSISRDGRTVAYVSQASNLTTTDVNTYQDVFVTTINQAPTIAGPGGQTTINEGQSLTIDLSQSTDPESEPLTFSWDINGDGTFGDATGSSITLTSAQLAALGMGDGPGVFHAKLNVSDSYGTTSLSFDITINNAPPVPTITPGTIDTLEGGSASFTGSATDPSAADVTAGLTLAWTAKRDGTTVATGSGASFNFNLTDNGSYVVTLTATDKDNGVGTTTSSFTVTNLPPSISTLNAPTTGTEGTAISFTPTVTDPGTADVAAGFTFSWTVTKDGSAFTTGSGSTVNFTPTDNGSYQVDVTAKDKDNATSTVSSATIAVANVPPNLHIAPTATVAANVTYNLTLAPTDPGTDTISQWQINWGDGSPVETLPGTAPSASHVYTTTPASWTLTVNATDEDGSYSATQAVTVSDVTAPVVTLGANASLNEGDTLSQAGSFTQSGSSGPWTATVDYGDGSGVQPLTLSGQSFTLNHQYAQDGSFTVTVKVTDNNNLSGASTITATVANVAPSFSAGATANLNEGDTLTRAGSFTDPGADTWTATVDYGDGSGPQALTLSGKNYNLSHLYVQNGSFTVSIAISDGTTTTTQSFQAVVGNIAPSFVIGVDASINEGDTFTRSGSFTDPGADTWTATVDYGEGAGAQLLTLSGKNFSLSHLYSQNGVFTVNVGINDGTTTTSHSFVITVANVAPTFALGADATLTAGDTLTRSGSFTDPGADTWTATVNYGTGAGAVPLTLSGKNFNLSNVYSTNGTFTVTVAINDGTVTTSHSFQVSVGNVPPAFDPGANATINEGDTFTRAGSFTDPGTDTWTATVNYGTGAGPQNLPLSGKNYNLSNVYSQNGTFTVTIAISDGTSTTSHSFTVTVANVLPTVNAGADVNVSSGSGNSFTSTGSFVDPGSDTWTATVDYGDGSGAQPLTLSGKAFTLGHTYATKGTFTVTVSVNDGSGAASDSLVVTIPNVTPVISLTTTATINEGSTFALAGSFTDSDPDTWNATVDYGLGAGAETLPLTGKSFSLSKVFPQDGTFNVTVKVTDGSATATSHVAVTVKNVVPVVATVSNVSLSVNQLFTQNVSFTDPGADTWTATVNYGEGNPDVPATVNADKTVSLSHTYTATGAYTINISVLDGSGFAGSSTFTATVSVVALTLSANNVAEKALPGTLVGTVTTSIPQTDLTATFSLLDDAGGLFVLNGQRLVVKNGQAIDLATASSHNVTIKEVNGTQTAQQTFTIQVVPGDRGDDLVGRDPVTGTLFVSRSTGTSFATTSYQGVFDPSVNWTDVLTGDFNGDGKDDVIARNPTNGEWWLARNTGTSFAVSKFDTMDASTTWVDVFAIDMNKDGKADILARNLATGDWFASFSQGTAGTTEKIGHWDNSVTWLDVHALDLNNDGRTDVIGRASGTGQYFASLNVPSATSANNAKLNNQLSAWATLTDGNPSAKTVWLNVQMADIDGDGRPDFVGRVQTTGNWYVSYGTAGKPTPAKFLTSWGRGAQFSNVFIADVTGDVKADLIGVTPTGQWQVSVAPSTRGGTTSLQNWSDIGRSYGNLFVGDFNHDGKADIAGVSTTGQWYVGLSSGADFAFTLWDGAPADGTRLTIRKGKIVN